MLVIIISTTFIISKEIFHALNYSPSLISLEFLYTQYFYFYFRVIIPSLRKKSM